MGNLFKEDTVPERSLGIKGVVYEARGRNTLLRIGPVGCIKTPRRNVFRV